MIEMNKKLMIILNKLLFPDLSDPDGPDENLRFKVTFYHVHFSIVPNTPVPEVSLLIIFE